MPKLAFPVRFGLCSDPPLIDDVFIAWWPYSWSAPIHSDVKANADRQYYVTPIGDRGDKVRSNIRASNVTGRRQIFFGGWMQSCRFVQATRSAWTAGHMAYMAPSKEFLTTFLIVLTEMRPIYNFSFYIVPIACICHTISQLGTNLLR